MRNAINVKRIGLENKRFNETRQARGMYVLTELTDTSKVPASLRPELKPPAGGLQGLESPTLCVAE
jgi:hypothetical protein